MNEAITVELQFFLISILWGVIILLVYDILRILRRLIPHNGIILALEDILFWVLTSLFIFAMIYTMNNGTIRGFSVMGMGIGMTLYHFIFSELFVKWMTKAFLLLLRPICILMNRITRVLRFMMSKIKKTFSKLYFQLKKTEKSVKIALNKKREVHNAKQAKRMEIKAGKKAARKSRKTEAKNRTHKKGKKASEKEEQFISDRKHSAELNQPNRAYRRSVVHRSGSISKRKTAGRE